jgi:hypothetical protein
MMRGLRFRPRPFGWDAAAYVSGAVCGWFLAAVLAMVTVASLKVLQVVLVASLTEGASP